MVLDRLPVERMKKTADFKHLVDRSHCGIKEKTNVFCHNTVLM